MENFIAGFLASFILVLRNGVRLITDPYKGMREITKENDPWQIIIILTISCLYFAYAASIRNSTLNPFVISRSAMESSGIFLGTFVLSIGLLYWCARLLHVASHPVAKSLWYLSAYSLIPSYFWFMLTSTLFFLLPPPRQPTLLGGLFSIVFIIYSLTMLFWRLTLLYLTVRFAFGTSFAKAIRVTMIYLGVLLPYSYLLYRLGLFRVPFI